VPEGRFQVALDDTLVRLIGPEPLVWRFDGSLEPFGQPFPYREFRGFNVFAAMQMMEELSELPLRISLGTLHGEPFLHPLHFSRIRHDLIADVQNNTPAVLVAFADASSHVIHLAPVRLENDDGNLRQVRLKRPNLRGCSKSLLSFVFLDYYFYDKIPSTLRQNSPGQASPASVVPEGTRQIAQLHISAHHKGVSPARNAYLPIAKRLDAKHYTLTKLTKLTGAAGGCAMPDHLTRRFPFTS
jgi:hypothetical protein